MASVAQLRVLRLLLQQQEEDSAALAILVHYRARARKRRFWVRPWIARRRRFGNYENLLEELERESHADFTNYMRMEPAMFHELLERLTPRLSKQDTKFRRALHPGLKLAITLRFLATGDSYHSLSYAFRVPHNTISKLVREVCGAMVDEYGSEVVSLPVTEDGWRRLSEQFASSWNFYHAVGALDGKHIAIKAPKNSASIYYNYNGFFFIMLLGLVDAEYKFIWVDVGANGSTSDCAVFNNSKLKEALESSKLGLPSAEVLPGDDKAIPYFLIGDDAFPLRVWLMKPFSGRSLTDDERIFNYRLSRARRNVENAFGILANRFRCLLTTLQLEPDSAKTLVMACVCLHNLMRVRYPTLQNNTLDREVDHQVVPGTWRSEGVLEDVRHVKAPTQATLEAKRQRVYLKHYYNNIGAVPWQSDMI